jgi:hypothetical protein
MIYLSQFLRDFVFNDVLACYPWECWECKYIPSHRQEVWVKFTRHPIPAGHLPRGTIIADRVKLIKKIDNMKMIEAAMVEATI